MGNRAPEANALNDAGSILRPARHGPSLGIFGLLHHALCLDLANDFSADCCGFAVGRRRENQGADGARIVAVIELNRSDLLGASA